MLTLNLLARIPKCPISVPVIQPSPQCIWFCSSSSESSDSDSDTDQKKQNTAIKTETSQLGDCDASFHLNQALNSLINKQPSRSVNVAIPPKNKKEAPSMKSIAFEKKLINAVKDVATTLGGDTQKTESDLMKKIIPSEEKKSNKKKAKNVQIDSTVPRMNLSELISGMQIDTEPDQNSYFQKKAAVAQALKHPTRSATPHQTRKEPKSKQVSVIESLQAGTRLDGWSRFPSSYRDRRTPLHADNLEFLWTGTPLNIFPKVPESSTNTSSPVLSTWEKLEQKYLKLSITHTPENIFQELILWTEQGKLWKFPIDNEQGMEKEQSIPFSDHVFLERHLKDWCPVRGPIRHFMELVCVGLSKNPYLTVEEKLEHITWYKEYFGSKSDVLEKIGALDTSNIEKTPIQS